MSFKYRDNPLYYRTAREALRLEQSASMTGRQRSGPKPTANHVTNLIRTGANAGLIFA